MLLMRTGELIGLRSDGIFSSYLYFSWLFDELTREEAISTLQNQPDGTFLVRPSSTIKGDLVLCVK